MRFLVLGGTGFVGRAVVAAAASGGHQVTLLNRGSRRPPGGTTLLVGDRTRPGETAALVAGQEWDVVVDTWSGAPSVVRESARALAGAISPAGRYVYVSSRSVYRYPPPPNLAEDGPVVDASPDAGDDVDYAAAKRGAEIAVESELGERALLARAGLILGPHEDVGRLPWWLMRIARGGPVVAPGPPGLALQYIDARDLAAWILTAAGRGGTGAFNLVGPPGLTTMGELLQTCVRVTGAPARLRWFEPAELLDAGVQPWTDLPIWLPPGEEHAGMHGGDVSKALAAGLTCRPVGQTVADTWDWLRGLDGPPPQRPDRPPVGLDPATEARLLNA